MDKQKLDEEQTDDSGNAKCLACVSMTIHLPVSSGGDLKLFFFLLLRILENGASLNWLGGTVAVYLGLVLCLSWPLTAYV